MEHSRDIDNKPKQNQKKDKIMEEEKEKLIQDTEHKRINKQRINKQSVKSLDTEHGGRRGVLFKTQQTVTS